MRKRMIVWTGIAAVLAFAPIAEARGGHGSRVQSQQCFGSCDDEDDTTATASAPTTTEAPASTATDAPVFGADGGSELVPVGSDPSTATSADPASTDPTTPADPVVSTGTTDPASSTTAASPPAGNSTTTPAPASASSTPTTAAPPAPASSTTSSVPAAPPSSSSSTPAPVDTTTTTLAAPPPPPPPPVDTTLPPPPPPPPPATFTMSTATPHVGEAVVFDGSAFACDPVASCSYTWTWFFRSADGTTTFTGGQMGLGTTVTYAFDAFAASKPFVTVVLRVSEGRLGPRTILSTSFPVLAA